MSLPALLSNMTAWLKHYREGLQEFGGTSANARMLVETLDEEIGMMIDSIKQLQKELQYEEARNQDVRDTATVASAEHESKVASY